LRVIKDVLGGFSQNIFSIFHKQKAFALLRFYFVLHFIWCLNSFVAEKYAVY